jgi:SAM-dependent methyltransferase
MNPADTPDDDLEDDADDTAVAGPETSRLYLASAGAFCRGRLELGTVDVVDDEAAVAAGHAAGLRLHRFKRATVLPRVQRALATLKGLAPSSLLDIGTGRGAFLWPLLDALPWLPVACVDIRADRVADLDAVARGGVAQLSALQGSATTLPCADGEFDVLTALEVLEHIEDVGAAAREILRVARRFVVVTVPSQPDNNPEHLRVFSKDSLTALFVEAGAARVNVDGVRGHFFAVVSVAAGGAP